MKDQKQIEKEIKLFREEREILIKDVQAQIKYGYLNEFLDHISLKTNRLREVNNSIMILQSTLI
jgi:hypothetical protein